MVGDLPTSSPRLRLLSLARVGTAGLMLSAAPALVAQTVPVDKVPAQPSMAPADVSAAPNAVPSVGSSAAQGAAPSAALGEIVVTAQKRSENAQRVPIAITALSAAKLAAAGISDTSDLKDLTPGLNYNTALGGFGQPRIRGVGTTATGPGIENPVATYVDGVYIGSAAGALFSLNDVEQVAVLKGPQGTLFGRNATGGLIQVTTLAPSQDFHVDLNGTYGNYRTAGGSAYITGGLTDTLAASIAVLGNNQADGFGKNVETGHDVQQSAEVALRGKLLWHPDAATKVTLSADYSHLTGADPAIRDISTTIFGGTTAGGKRDIQSDVDPFLETRQYGVSLTAQHDFSKVQLLSISAYRNSFLHASFDADQTPAQLLVVDQLQRDKQFSQELQLLSTTSGPFKWVLGAYYFHGSGQYDPNQTSGSFLPGPDDLYTTQKLDSYAAFGQGTYALGDRTNLTAGLRYTIDHRSLRSSETITVNGVTVPAEDPQDVSKTFRKLTWRLSLDHRFSDKVLGYVSYNRGFKSGSFVPQTFPADVLKPETLDAYEVGIKSELFDRRVRLNVAGFYYDYKNIQVNQIENGLLYVYNGKGARTYGVDADLEVRVTSQLSLTAGASALHDRYKSFPNAILTTPITPVFPAPAYPAANGGNLVSFGDATDNRLQNTPDWTGNLGATYTVDTPIGSFVLAGNYYHNDGYFASPENRLRQPAYDVVDASLTWTSADKHYSIRVWGKNLGNALYSEQLDAVNFGDNRVAAPPRTFGVTGGLHF